MNIYQTFSANYVLTFHNFVYKVNYRFFLAEKFPWENSSLALFIIFRGPKRESSVVHKIATLAIFEGLKLLKIILFYTFVTHLSLNLLKFVINFSK